MERITCKRGRKDHASVNRCGGHLCREWEFSRSEKRFGTGAARENVVPLAPDRSEVPVMGLLGVEGVKTDACGRYRQTVL